VVASAAMSDSDATPRRSTPWVAIGLVAIAFLVYGRVAGHEFLLNWDDLTYVVENEAIRGLGWGDLRTMFGQPYFGNYAPLHLLSYAIDHALWGLEPAGFLLTNVALHAVNGWLLYALLLRLGLSRTGAAFAAAVFLVHPVQVESVAWVSERKNVLAMTFSLASLHAYLTYRAAEVGRSWLPYLATLVALVAALLTKAVAVVVPPLFVLIDLCLFEPAKRRGWIVDKIPFAVAAGALILATLSSQEAAIAEGRATFRMDGLTTVFTMVPVVARYVGMVFWPAQLTSVYAPTVRASADLAFWASTLLVVTLVIIGVALWLRRREWLAWYAFFFVALLPVLHIVPLPTLMNDRYLYFPMLGAAALAGLALDRLAARGSGRRVATWAAAGAIVAVLAAAAFVRTGVWRDDLTLWRDVTEKTPGSALGWTQLGMSLIDAGHHADALRAYHRALAVDPTCAMALVDLGAAYNGAGQPESGRPFLLRALEVAPGHFEALMNLGIGYGISGDLAAAERAFAEAASARPWDAGAVAALQRARSMRRAR
jgi:protein O-mannosyl-transferase